MTAPAKLQPLPIHQLVRGKYQPRRHFKPEELQELADSIKTIGLLQPIVVRPLSKDQYEIVAGERRWRAAQLAGLHIINCMVIPYTDEQALQASIIENINRADLNPIEEAEAYQRLIDEFNYLHEEVAAAVGKNRTTITNALRLLRLEKEVRNLLIAGELTEGHGKILAGLSADLQITLAKLCIEKNWSVRKTELEVKKRQLSKEGPYSDPNLKHLERALSDHLGNPVRIDYEDRGGGFIKIRFNNIDELEGHFNRIGFKYQD